jgi:hypothetical protein
MNIDTRVIKKVLYKMDPDAKKDEDFVESINMLLHIMEDEQIKYTKKNNTESINARTTV